MKKLLILLMAGIFAVMSFGCGAQEASETTFKETTYVIEDKWDYECKAKDIQLLLDKEKDHYKFECALVVEGTLVEASLNNEYEPTVMDISSINAMLFGRTGITMSYDKEKDTYTLAGMIEFTRGKKEGKIYPIEGVFERKKK